MTIAWQDEQKRLTPDDVQSVSFPLSRLGRRGYDEDHVRAFLQEVEREIVTLLNEKVSLWNEVDRSRRKRRRTGARSGPSSPTCGHSARSTAPTCAPTPRGCCAASPSGSAARPARSSRRRPM